LVFGRDGELGVFRHSGSLLGDDRGGVPGKPDGTLVCNNLALELCVAGFQLVHTSCSLALVLLLV
jgi:hypothetical protein